MAAANGAAQGKTIALIMLCSNRTILSPAANIVYVHATAFRKIEF